MNTDIVPAYSKDRVINSQKIVWIDVLKGIGIILVVYAHIFPWHISRYIFLFHMPLFFFISGYLTKPKIELKKFFVRKFNHLMVPYFFFLLLIYVPQEIIEVLNNRETFIQAILRALIGGRLLYGWSSVFWFTTCFFFSQQVLNYLLINFKDEYLYVLMVFFLFISYLISNMFAKYWLPGNVQVLFSALPISFVGYKFRSIGNYKKKYWGILLIIVVWITYYYDANFYNMKINEYGIPIVTFCSSVIVIVCLINLAKIIQFVPFLTNTLQLFGKGSMVVMYIHQPAQFILDSQFGLHSTILRFIVVLVLSILAYKIAATWSLTRFLVIGLNEKKTK